MPKSHLKLKTSQGIMTFKPQDLSAHLAVSRPFFINAPQTREARPYKKAGNLPPA